MAKTQVRSDQLEDGGIRRADLNTATAGSAVITKAVQGTGMSFSSTGADAGTGDVTVNIDPASTTDVLTGTNTSKPVTADALAALWEQASDLASAGTITLGEGGYFVITGTTTIADIDFTTDKAGRHAWLRFSGVLTLTHGAALILPTAANIVTAVGDIMCVISEGSDVVRCLVYQRASGAALSGSGSGLTYPQVLSAVFLQR